MLMIVMHMQIEALQCQQWLTLLVVYATHEKVRSVHEQQTVLLLTLQDHDAMLRITLHISWFGSHPLG